MTIAAIRNLTVAFNRKPACRDIDLDLPAGRITVLVGRSGSGKTTLLRAVNRLNECLENSRTTGSVHLDLPSGPLDAYSPATDVENLRRRVGMVFQTPAVLPVSILRNFLLPLELTLSITGPEAKSRAETALRDVGLLDEVADRLDHDATTLSGGQQQRLCLARALALDPEILLLDEPTASVDHRSAEIIENLLRSLTPRLTLAVVSHSLRQARKLADRLLLMRDGRLVGAWDRETGDEAGLDALLDEAF
ncbi:phosphate ABC transporter ATP-binding protein [Pseudodesulfovibrio sp.]|uniref:phosphate ABC transporter ATP-binding protein n=1 Tax=Pseudodesulfovibrio sp. TaxID=2035812 RepID=UPI00261F1D92|nr:phosphate ABC transporter ATP-binding protein [Pseudodesulfovibrio sp.]MDD3313567.1 phosphate ABC transporter ATP-binding protein [Pseudodesulfovibrio sp.]